MISAQWLPKTEIFNLFYDTFYYVTSALLPKTITVDVKVDIEVQSKDPRNAQLWLLPVNCLWIVAYSQYFSLIVNVIEFQHIFAQKSQFNVPLLFMVCFYARGSIVVLNIDVGMLNLFEKQKKIEWCKCNWRANCMIKIFFRFSEILVLTSCRIWSTFPVRWLSVKLCSRIEPRPTRIMSDSVSNAKRRQLLVSTNISKNINSQVRYTKTMIRVSCIIISVKQ